MKHRTKRRTPHAFNERLEALIQQSKPRIGLCLLVEPGGKETYIDPSVVAELTDAGLATWDGNILRLTDAGKDAAQRVYDSERGQ